MVRFEYKKFDTFEYNQVLADIDANELESGSIPWDKNVDVWSLIGSNTASMRVNGEIVGYCLLRVVDHHHYQKKVALSEILYVRPEHRGTKSIKFIKFIEDTLRKIGVEGFFQSSSAAKDISKLMNRLGYNPTETVYFKEL